ncbi:hypothetical protein QBC37DRAFT_270307, partial [Rhypophila decipiens]
MTLQDIYQWFRENTSKAKSDGKGWQNSIRHNLTSKICLSTITNAPGGSENKKYTKWYLEPWAVTGGVQSTTRYRKSNNSR